MKLINTLVLTLLSIYLVFSQSSIEGALISCDKKILLTINSPNIIDSIIWNWGDGNTSNSINGIYTYSISGIYNISAQIFNNNNSEFIYSNQPAHVYNLNSCTLPNNYCCSYGINKVKINNFINLSQNAIEGNRNFECIDTIEVLEGERFHLQVLNNNSVIQDFKIWVDLNNNGIIENTELIYQKLNETGISDSIIIPSNAQLNTELKMVIGADIPGSNFSYCNNISRGQFETYTIKIISTTLIPIADFSTHLQNDFTCNGFVNFYNSSFNNPTSFIWDFGDGNISFEENPSHKYLNNGNYWVKLIAINSAGTDTFQYPQPIQVNLNESCDTIYIPNTGTYISNWYCNGIITDDGITENYSNNSNGLLILSPDWASNISLNFIEFDYENGFDFLYIYDGPNSNYPLIGKYTGNNLPNGGTIQSSGPSLLLKQVTDDVYTKSGFIAKMNCTLDHNEAIANEISLYPNPTSKTLNFTSLSTYDEYIITDILGNVLLKTKETSIDIESFPVGIYLLIAKNKSSKVVHKWIKSN